MTTLAEIETAVARLPREQKYSLYLYLQPQLQEAPAASHEVLDIAPIHLGPLLKPLTDDEDLLNEMLGENE